MRHNFIRMLFLYVSTKGAIPSSSVVLKPCMAIIVPSVSYHTIIVINFCKMILKIVDLGAGSTVGFVAPVFECTSTGVDSSIGLQNSCHWLLP